MKERYMACPSLDVQVPPYKPLMDQQQLEWSYFTTEIQKRNHLNPLSGLSWIDYYSKERNQGPI
jgi:hypothetical protein